MPVGLAAGARCKPPGQNPGLAAADATVVQMLVPPIASSKHLPPGPSVTCIRHDVPPMLPEPMSPDATLPVAAWSLTHVSACKLLAGLKMSESGVYAIWRPCAERAVIRVTPCRGYRNPTRRNSSPHTVTLTVRS